MKYSLHRGDCLSILREMPSDSIDSIVTDPPYGLKFMSRKWDYDVPSVEAWAEMLRVLKPGGHLLAFSGARTYHRMVVNVEDAGFEIRDQLMWIYGQGMPKSRNQRDEWEGWGTALKPAHEPIVMARKPFKGTVEKNLALHGTGAIHIDACRVPLSDEADKAQFVNNHLVTERLPESYRGRSLGLHNGGWKQIVGAATIPDGRWPANVLHDGSDEVRSCFPDAAGQQGDLKAQSRDRKSKGILGDMPPAVAHTAREESDKNAARFFFCAKATTQDREEGLESLQPRLRAFSNGASGEIEPVDAQDGFNSAKMRRNFHETVKPTEVCRWMQRLVTPPGGVTLDPYCGSGSFGKAAMLEGFNYIGIDKDEDEHGNQIGYLEIAEARVRHAWLMARGRGEP